VGAPSVSNTDLNKKVDNVLKFKRIIDKDCSDFDQDARKDWLSKFL
jgi:hypothetical protein